MYTIMIRNMLNPQNMFLNIQEFNDSTNTNITILEYNTLKSCIPKTFSAKHKHFAKLSVETYLQIGNLKKLISIVKTKELYQNLIMDKETNQPHYKMG